MVKAGFNKNRKQRFKCRACGCHFTRSTPKGYPLHIKRRAIQLYLEGISYRTIGRILNVSNVTILNWIKNEGNNLNKFQPPYRVKIDKIILDDSLCFINQKHKLEGTSLIIPVDSPSPEQELLLYYVRETTSLKMKPNIS